MREVIHVFFFQFPPPLFEYLLFICEQRVVYSFEIFGESWILGVRRETFSPGTFGKGACQSLASPVRL